MGIWMPEHGLTVTVSTEITYLVHHVERQYCGPDECLFLKASVKNVREVLSRYVVTRTPRDEFVMI